MSLNIVGALQKEFTFWHRLLGGINDLMYSAYSNVRVVDEWPGMAQDKYYSKYTHTDLCKLYYSIEQTLFFKIAKPQWANQARVVD